MFFYYLLRHFFLIGMLIVVATSCHNDEEILPPPTPTPENPAEDNGRTVLIYCTAQNDLGLFTWATDSTEIAKGAQYIDAKNQLLVYVDDARLPRIYQFSAQNAPQLIRQWTTDEYSTNPRQLQDVVSYVSQCFPSKEYGLVFWSHSDGWLPSTNTNYGTLSPLSYGIDVGPDGNMGNNKDHTGNIGAQMNIEEMAEALSATGIHFKYIFFDSCLMQCIETIYALRKSADYIVASPMPIPFDGAYYTHMVQSGLFADSVSAIVETYYDDVTEMTNVYSDYGLVISAVQTAGVEELATTIKNALASTDWETTFPDMKDVDKYYRYLYSYYYRPHFYDLRSALQKITDEQQFQAIDAALNKVVKSYRATSRFWIGPGARDYTTIDVENCCGISMFVPQKEYATNAYQCIFGNLNEKYKATEWATAIRKN